MGEEQMITNIATHCSIVTHKKRVTKAAEKEKENAGNGFLAPSGPALKSASAPAGGSRTA